MGYELIFLRRAPGQSWEDACEAAENNDAKSLLDPAVWDQVLAGARQILGKVSISVTDRYYELDHDRTGIQLVHHTSDRIEITAPYGDSDVKARAVIRQMCQLGRVVEEATGLQGYDPQLGVPLSDVVAHADQSAELFDTVGGMMARRERTTAHAREHQRPKGPLVRRWMRWLVGRGRVSRW